MGERETLLPWFGPMLEASFSEMFEQTICPNIPIFAEVDARGGLVVDLGCGNGWYLRALGRQFGRGSAPHHAPLLHHMMAVGEAHQFIEVAVHDQDREPLRA